MKNRTFWSILSLSLALPLILGGMSPALADDAEERAPKREKKAGKKKKGKKERKSKEEAGEADANYITKRIPGWNNPDAARRSLLSQIKNALKGDSPDHVEKFIQKPQNRLMVAQYMLAQYDALTPPDMAANSRKKLTQAIANLPGEIERDKEKLKTMRGRERMAFQAAIRAKQASIKTLETELKNTPWTLKELAAHRDGRKVLSAVTGNLKWMENICFSGPCVAPGRALHILACIAKQHPDVYEDEVVRDIATATALEFARYNWDFEKALDRADYYITNWKAGRLNVLFDTLPMYLRRIVCGCKGDNIAGDRKSLEWALDNVHVPAERYMGSPHRCGYRLYNLYGDSIHAAEYYMPWEHIYGGNHFTRALYVGCVCGGISHFGAFAAVANGVPALTNGEPGHCAYVLWLNGKWTPGNTISWERGLHWQPVQGMHSAFSSLHLGSELYTELSPDTHASNVYRVLAHGAAEGKRDKQAIGYFTDAASAQPINIGVWQEYNNYLGSRRSGDMELLSNMQDQMCYTLAPRYPEVTAEFLGNWVYPKMMAAKMKPDALMTRFHVFWDNLRDMGPERWRIEKFGRQQIELLSHKPAPGGDKAPAPNAEHALEVFGLMMNNSASKADYLPVLIGWGEAMARELDSTTAAAIAEASREISKTGMGALGGSGKSGATGQLMLSAARSHDIDTFQRLGANSADSYATPGMPELPEMPGKFLSGAGLLQTSSTCGHDAPVEHWGVLRPGGGRFHTDKEENAWATVMLPKPGYLNGVVIVATNGNHQRLHNMEVQISDDGENWHTIKRLGNCTQRVIKIEFPEELGRYVRIMRKGGPEFFHLNGIYVYGRDAA